MSISLLPKIGADHGNGSLDLAQRWRLTLALLAAQLARRRRARPSLRPEVTEAVLWRSIEAPRGRLADRAWELARQQQPPWLINHSLRTHAWAQAFGVLAGLTPDREALFAAAMLHDAGLTPAAATPASHCFAVRGARYAKTALEGSTDAKTADVIADAIAHHLDLQVDLRDGVEAHLLQAGAMADVLGRRITNLPPAFRVNVLATHPRLKMKDELCRCMAQESVAAPHTRMGCYVRRIDFLGLIRQAPYDG